MVNSLTWTALKFSRPFGTKFVKLEFSRDSKAFVLMDFMARLKSCPDTKHFSKLARNRLTWTLVLQSSITPLELGELSRKTDQRRAFLTCAIWRCNKLSRVPWVLLNLRNPGDIRGGGLGLGGLWGCFAYASMSDSRYFFLFGTDLSAEPRRGRRTALTLPVGPPPQKNRSRPSDSRPET
jgi:hypothetical protein